MKKLFSILVTLAFLFAGNTANAIDYLSSISGVTSLRTNIPPSPNWLVNDSSPLGTRTPLVFIHGINPKDNPQDEGWSNFVSFFYDHPELMQRYKPYFFGYTSNTISVRMLGDELSEILDRWGKYYDPTFKGRDIVIVAHSMGGLVARSFMNGATNDGARVIKLITLATPHHGSYMGNNSIGTFGALRSKLVNTGWVIGVTTARLNAMADFWGPTGSYNRPNRSNLLWDNYDNLFSYNIFNQDEINTWLVDLNNRESYTSKIIAYSGFMAPDGNIFGVGGQHDYKYNNIAGLISTVSGDTSDGIVPLTSAQFSGKSVTLRTPLSDYDHTQMWQGKGSFVTGQQSEPLFLQLKQDLVQIYDANFLPDSVTVTAKTLCSNGTGQILLTRSNNSTLPTTYKVYEGTQWLGDFAASLEYRFNSGTPNTLRSFSVTAMRDTGGSKYSNVVTVNTPDCAAPADITPPSAPGLPQTSAWSRTNLFSIPLVLPNDPSNIARVFYKLGQPPISSMDGLSLPLPQYNPLPVALNQTSGTQTLYVWLEDGAGNRSYINRSSMTLKVDNTAPSITISSPTTAITSLSSMPLSGSFTDDLSGVASIKWFNDQGGSGEVPVTTPSLNANWQLAPITLYPGDNNLSVVAVDVAGNEGRANIKITKTDTTNSGSIMFTLSPSGAVTAGARWRANGGVWHLSGEYELNVPAGVAQIDFQGAGNYVAPQSSPVIVTAGQVTQRTASFPLTVVNVPPYTPSNPYPANGTMGLSRVNPSFSWTGGSSVGPVDYAFFFDTNPNPGVYVGYGSTAGASVQLVRTLASGTTYYWKVKSMDVNSGTVTESPVWSFTTEYAMPDLIVSNVVLNGNVAPGANVTADVTVQNIGNFASYGTSYVHVYLSSSPGGKNVRLTPNVPSHVPVLQPGQTQTFSIPVTLTGLQSGTSYLDAWIDSTQAGQVEGNINNNLRSIPLSYLDGQAPSVTYAGLTNTFAKTGIANSIAYWATDDTGIRTIDFYYSVDDGVNWLPIEEGYVPATPPNVGTTYRWAIPANLPIVSNLKIRVVARDASGNAGEIIAGPYVVHDGTAPSVTVLSPNGGEILPMGSNQQIQVSITGANPIANVGVYFSYNSTRVLVAAAIPGNGILTWNVPNNLSTTTGKILVQVEDVNGNVAEDYSDGFFTVRDTSAPPPAPWTTPQAITSVSAPQTIGNVQMATDAAGNLHMAYIAQSDTGTNPRTITQIVHYRKRTGSVWSADQVAYSNTQQTDPSLTGFISLGDLRFVVSSAGTPNMVWGTFDGTGITGRNQNDIFFTSFNGSNWSAPLNISANLPGFVGIATQSGSPRIQVDSANAVHVVWVDGSYWNVDYTMTGQPSIYYRKMTVAGGWEPAINISGTFFSGYLDLYIDSSNTLHLGFLGSVSNSSAVLHASNSGSGWTSPIVVANGVDSNVRIASDSNNHLHMVWRNWNNNAPVNKAEIFYSYFDGVTWSPKELVSSTTNLWQTTISVDSLNRPHVTWEDWGYPSKLFYRFKSGNQWSAPTQLHYDSQIVVNYSSATALSALNNEMHVAWVSTVNGAGTILYNHANVGSTADSFSPSVSVVAPVAGATLSSGSTYVIQWSANDNVGVANVDLHYSADNGVTWTLIAANQPNTGTYSWVVPAQASLQVRVTARDAAGNTGAGFSGSVTTSDATPPTIALTAPTSGAPLAGNSTVNVNWTATDNVAVTRIDLDYSLDSGVTWLTMANALSNSGTYAWLTPNSPTSALLIRAVAHDAAGYTTVASTAQPLTIVRANIPPLAPSMPFPLVAGVNVPVLSPMLNWTGGDPDGDALTYQIRFGTTATPPVIATVSNNTFAAGTLQYATQYYWQVEASDGNASTASPVWSFTTEALPLAASAKASQSISFGTAPAVAVGDTGKVSAIATSGLAVSFSSTPTSICTISGNIVKGIAAGTCIIAADQAGDASYSAAVQATQSITIDNGDQTVIIQPGPEGTDTCYGTVYVASGCPDTADLYVGGWGDTYYDFLKFDLTGSPSSSTTVKVELWLYGSAPNDPVMQMNRITGSWTETGITLANNPSSVFYKNMPAFPSANAWIVTDITDLYKGWKDGIYPNYGVKLVPTNISHTNGSIASSDNAAASSRPKLLITTTLLLGATTFTFTGTRSEYRITQSGGSYTVTDLIAGRDGTRTLTSAERLTFSDMTVNLTIQAKAASIAAADLQRLQELYVAFFNRVPAADGLAYWIDRFKAGSTINQIAESFYAAGVQNASLTGFSSAMSNSEFINVIYRNVLGRPEGAAAVGMNYWSGELASGRATRGSLVSSILDSAHYLKGDTIYGYAWVADLLDNKIFVANQFSVTLGLTYLTPEASISNGMAIAAAVTSTSTAAALALIGVGQ